jgi:hypothetical protein
MTMEELSVQGATQVLRFTGVMLGQATSAAPDKTRWAEIAIFRVESGKYVVAGVGRSTADGETDRFWFQVCDGPQGVIKRLHMTDDDGLAYLPAVSARAISQACVADAGLAAAYSVQMLD